MSASLRRSLRPMHKGLVDKMAERPQPPDFDDDQEGGNYLRVLKHYKNDLTSQGSRFLELYHTLIGETSEDAAQQSAIEELIDKETELVLQYDGLVASLNWDIEELTQQQIAATARIAQNRGPPPAAAVPKNVAIKLPKLEFTKFSGNVMYWQEFWDSFDSAINKNDSIQPVEKMNYLKNMLTGEAKRAICGLSATNDNYRVALNTLKERFGNQQNVIDAHYSALSDLLPATNFTNKLRFVYDSIEQHLNSLQALGENVDHRHFVSLIRSKLPPEVIFRLEETKNGDAWDVQTLRERLQRYLSAREIAETNMPSNNSTTFKKPYNSNNNGNSSNFSQQRGNFSQHKTNHSGYKPTTGALISNEKPKQNKTCAFCGKNHWSDQCTTYPSMDSRKERIKGNCFGCLNAGHRIQECKTVRPCFYCKREKNHHSSLCPTKFSSKRTESVSVASERANNSISGDSVPAESSLLASGETVSLQTATTTVASVDKSTETSARLLLDTGSHRSYITEKLVKELKLKTHSKSRLSIFTFGSLPPKEINTAVVTLKLKLLTGEFFEISANVIPTITGGITRAPVDFENFGPLYQKLPLADSVPKKSESLSVDLLIGNDYYWDLVTSEKIELSRGLYLVGSKLGWILSGRHKTDVTNKLISTALCVQMAPMREPTADINFVSADAALTAKLDVNVLWDLESIGIKDKTDDLSDEMALEKFNTTVQVKDSRYYVTWPWKEENCDLPSNYQLSLGRLTSLVKRYKDQPEVFQQYQTVLENQLQKGMIERVDANNRSAGLKHYIPHHAVVTPDKTTTKLRIVYDASAKAKKENLSLNECLHRGPVLLEDLCGVLLRFRLNKIAIVSDIEKAFLQIGLQDDDRDVTRFLWLKDPKLLSTDNNIETFRFARVPFGIISSPFLLLATITYHLKLDNSEIALNILKNIYVDNIITGVESEEEAVAFYQKTKSLFSKASMNVREWASNSQTFLSAVAKTDKSDAEDLKVLGYNWSTKTDKMSVYVPTFDSFCFNTKRSVLKYIASIFDPLGYFSPTVLLAKVFLQKLWSEKFDWDDNLPEKLIGEFKSIVLQINCLNYSFARFVNVGKGSNYRLSLHCFCDASKLGYGACVYLLVTNDNTISVYLLFAKSRLAPVKVVTLPRLELLAVVIGCRCLEFVEKHLQIKISQKFVWTDSQCVLHWLDSKKPLTVFVRNRICEIKRVTNTSFHYVATADNPADIASRGKPASELLCSNLWWSGPKWLSLPQYQWPKGEFMPKTALQDSEVCEISAVASEPVLKTFFVDYFKFSSLTKLLRVTAWCLRFIRCLKSKQKGTGCLNSDEILIAKTILIKFVQDKHCAGIIDAVKGNKRHPLKENFQFWLDKNEVLRCKSRLENSQLPELTVNPIFLPNKDHLTVLVVEHFHKKLFHAGVAQTLSQIRTEFWIPAGRSKVFNIIKTCNSCKRFDGGPYQLPRMPALPGSRVLPSTPFDNTGLDYLGPLFVKDRASTSTKKVWICLFTCLSTRAIHLELVSDMTADEFLLCLRRFIARRGKPSVIWSDNAPQFKLVSRVVHNSWKDLQIPENVMNYVSLENIRWKFIVEYAPWMGGFYERLIRLVKQCMRKTIGKICLSVTQLETIITEIEAVINSRPLAYIGSDFESGFAITPAHFLSLNVKTGTPQMDNLDLQDPNFISSVSSRENLLQLWKKGNRHLENFWKLWERDYLLNLRERNQMVIKQKRCRSDMIPKIGDIVLIPNQGPRGTWKLARITKLITSFDGEIRAAEVITSNGSKFSRSLNHLFPLECNESEFTEDLEKIVTQPEDPVQRRSCRAAAKDASIKIKHVFSHELSE